MAKDAPRTNSHKIADRAVNFVSTSVTDVNGELEGMFRLVSGWDYGVDAIIELFENGYPTGKMAFAQIKGTSKEIKPLARNHELISLSNISSSNLHYALQNRIPLVLIYANVEKSKEHYYFHIIQTGPKNPVELLKLDQDTVTVHLSANNRVDYYDDATALLRSINNYYENKSDFLAAP